MKTKNLLYILLSILVFSFASCTDDDKTIYIKHDELPENIQSFLGEYLRDWKEDIHRKRERLIVVPFSI